MKNFLINHLCPRKFSLTLVFIGSLLTANYAQLAPVDTVNNAVIDEEPLDVICVALPTVVAINGDVASWNASSADNLYKFKLQDLTTNLVLDEHNVVGTSTVMTGLIEGVTYRVKITPRCGNGGLDTNNETFVDFVKSIDGVIHGDVQILLAPPVSNPPMNVNYCQFGEVRTALENGTSFATGHPCASVNPTILAANGFTTPYRQLILNPSNSAIRTQVLGLSWLDITTAIGNRFANYTVGAITNRIVAPPTSLPVKMINFTAETQKQTVELKWTTATEQNSKVFEVQRSKNGTDYQTIGKVNAAGTSNTSLNYQFTDKKPLQEQSYYRLNIVDFDGHQEYSTLVAVRFTEKTAEWCHIYPTEINDKITVVIANNELPQNTEIKLTNAIGATIKQQTLDAATTFTEFLTGDLPAGIYYLYLQKGDSQHTHKLVKK